MQLIKNLDLAQVRRSTLALAKAARILCDCGLALQVDKASVFRKTFGAAKDRRS